MTLDIMVDVDDVIVPWFSTIADRCVAAWGESPNGPCTRWDMHSHWEGRSRDEWLDLVIAATEDGLYTTIPPIRGSVEGVNLLKWWGYRVHIVTARGFFENGDQIRRWTQDYLWDFGIGHDTLTFAQDKVAAMEQLGVRFDFAIDDGVHNYRRLDEAGIEVWLNTAPHNLDFEAERRIDSLWEFANLVRRTDIHRSHLEAS